MASSNIALKSIDRIIRNGIDATDEAASALEELDAILASIEAGSDEAPATVLARIGRGLVHEWASTNNRNHSEFTEQLAAFNTEGNNVPEAKTPRYRVGQPDVNGAQILTQIG